MPEFEPIVVLPAQNGEFSPKGGGGSSPDPLVPVDATLRGSLVAQLQTVQALAEQNLPGRSQGVPLAITVRDQALAKSKLVALTSSPRQT